MKAYRQQIAKVFKICWKSSISIFLIGVLGILFLDLVAWAFQQNQLGYLISLLSLVHFLIIYIILPFLTIVVLARVLMRYGGGAMLFSLASLTIQFLILFIIAAFLLLFFSIGRR